MVIQTGRNLTNRLRSLLGLPSDVAGMANPGEQSTIITGANQDTEGYRLPDYLLERYEVKGVLGRGAFGIVYLAKDSRIGRLIAIKQLYRRHSDNRGILSRFIQEARIAGQLEHENIVTIFDVTGSSGTPCIIMEYLGGGNLATVLRTENTLSEYRSLTCIRGVLAGLSAAHRLRVIHRDVKPANILFDRQGTPKLGDFGVAHLPLEAGGLVADSDDAPAGTPDYMAPEQVVADAKIDGRADLYSAGGLLYRMLTGGRLYNFGNSRDFEGMSEIIKSASPLPAVKNRLEDVSDATTSLILSLLAYDPDHRIQNADAALELVDDALEAISPSDGWHNRRDYRPARSRDLFADLLRLFLVDGIVTPPERHELDVRAKRLGISEKESRILEEEIREELNLPSLEDLERFSRDAEIDPPTTPERRTALDKFARELNISPAEQRQLEDDLQGHLDVSTP